MKHNRLCCFEINSIRKVRMGIKCLMVGMLVVLILIVASSGGSFQEHGVDELKDGAEDDNTGGPVLIFERTSIGAVENDPPNPTSFSIDQEWMVTEIKTYHWNYGQGKAPEIIGLQDEGGKILGMWIASGEPGYGGVPDAYWTAKPNLALQPGTYTIFDSDPVTWSHNWETNGEGIVWVHGQLSKVSEPATRDAKGPLFIDDFNDGDMAGWNVGGLLGNWSLSMVSAQDGVLRQNSNDYGGSEGVEGTYVGTYVIAGDPSWRNYELQVRVRPVDNDGIGLLFRYGDSSNYYRFLWVGDESSAGPLRRLDKIADGVQMVLKLDGDEGKDARYDPERWYSLKVSLDGDVIGIYIDDVLWGEVQDGEIERGAVGLFSYAQVGAEFDDVVVRVKAPSPAGLSSSKDLMTLNRTFEVGQNPTTEQKTDAYATTSQVWFDKGFFAQSIGDYEGALENFDKAIEEDPNFKDAWIVKGNVFTYMERYDDALEAYEQALEIDQDDGSVWELKGLTLSMLERYDESMKAFEEAERLSGDGWGSSEYGEVLIDAPPGGWEGVVPGVAI